MDALTTPLRRWRQSLTVRSAAGPEFSFCSTVRGRRTRSRPEVPNVWGGVEHKRYIIEAKGSGLAFFDYDNDGWLDIYLTNGTRLGEKWPREKRQLRSYSRITATELLPM